MRLACPCHPPATLDLIGRKEHHVVACSQAVEHLRARRIPFADLHAGELRAPVANEEDRPGLVLRFRWCGEAASEPPGDGRVEA